MCTDLGTTEGIVSACRSNKQPHPLSRCPGVNVWRVSCSRNRHTVPWAIRPLRGWSRLAGSGLWLTTGSRKGDRAEGTMLGMLPPCSIKGTEKKRSHSAEVRRLRHEPTHHDNNSYEAGRTPCCRADRALDQSQRLIYQGTKEQGGTQDGKRPPKMASILGGYRNIFRDIMTTSKDLM